MQRRTVSAAFRTSRLFFYRRFLQKQVSGCPCMLTFVYTHAMLANRRRGSGYPLRGLFPVGKGLPFACNASCFYAVAFTVSTAETAPCFPARADLPQ